MENLGARMDIGNVKTVSEAKLRMSSIAKEIENRCQLLKEYTDGKKIVGVN